MSTSTVRFIIVIPWKMENESIIIELIEHVGEMLHYVWYTFMLGIGM